MFKEQQVYQGYQVRAYQCEHWQGEVNHGRPCWECKDFEFYSSEWEFNSLSEMGNHWRALNTNVLKGALIFIASNVLEHPLYYPC